MKKKVFKTLVLVVAFFLFIGVSSISTFATGYTYDHKGNVIYSTEGFTVNETPYIYSDFGIDNINKFLNPTDLFIYNQDPVHGTIAYLLDGGSPTTRPSTIFMLDENLKMIEDGEIDYFYYNPNKLSDNELLNMKSALVTESNGNYTVASKAVIGDGSAINGADVNDETLAADSCGFSSLDEIRGYEKVKLYMMNASAVYRSYKTNSLPYTDYLYVCDTDNNQVLVINAESYDNELKTYEIVQVVTSPKDELDEATFRPTKVTVDAAGRIYVVANGVTNGIMEFGENGSFDRYVGTNYVTLKAWEIFWRNFKTESQLANSESILATTFTAMAYKNNMIYATSYALEKDGYVTDDTKMIKKINPSGKDVLRRNGYTPPKGDFAYTQSNDGNGATGASRFVGIAVNDYGIYTAVDEKRGRLFTYDNEGNLLYISGNGGTSEAKNNTQTDKITIPVAIQYLGENVLVLDSKKDSIIKFEPTEIAQVINKAVENEYHGRSEEAYKYWEQVILLNANYEYGYVGIGKHYLNQKDYKTALEYFKLGHEKIYYGKAYKQYRDQIIKENFTWAFTVFAVLVVGGVVFKKIRRKKLGIVDEEESGIGDE